MSSATLRALAKNKKVLEEISYHAAKLLGEAPAINPFDRWTCGDLLIYSGVAHQFSHPEWRLLAFACRSEFKRRRSDQEVMHGKFTSDGQKAWRQSPISQFANVI